MTSTVTVHSRLYFRLPGLCDQSRLSRCRWPGRFTAPPTQVPPTFGLAAMRKPVGNVSVENYRLQRTGRRIGQGEG